MLNSFKYSFTVEDNCVECDEVIEGLEKIDDETDALDITFVKVNDPRYAKKYGVNKLPALVYFRRKFPSIYRGEINTIFKCFYSQKFFQSHYSMRIRSWNGLHQTGIYICYPKY